MAYWIHKIKILFTKINQRKHKRDHVISIKANNGDLVKNLKLGLKMKVFFFSSPFIKNSGTLYSLLVLLEKYYAKEKLNSEMERNGKLINSLRNHWWKLIILLHN